MRDHAMKNGLLKGASVAAIGAAVAISPLAQAFAQDDTIVVTATKRETTAQETPISLEVVSGERIESFSVRDLQDLSGTTPNFFVGDGLLTTDVSIRGLGSQPERGFEQSVGMFIDGVYMPRSRQYRSPFFDLNRAEILRGPQAALFGLNSTAGAVSIITARSRPGDEYSASLVGEYEVEYGQYRVAGHVGGGLSDTIGARLAVQYRDANEGYYQNAFTGNDEGAQEELIIRPTIVIEPTDNFSIDIKYEYAEFERTGDIGEQTPPAALNGLAGTDDGELNFVRTTDGTNIPLLVAVFGGPEGAGHEQINHNLAITANYGIGEYTLTGVFGYNDSDSVLYTDLDMSPLTLLDSGIDEQYDQYSVEARITSPSGRKFEWILGGYWQTSDLFNAQPNIIGDDFLGTTNAGVFANASATLDNTSWSIFGTATLHLSDNLRLNAGARWVDVSQDYARFGDCTTLDEAQLPQAFLDAAPTSFFCSNLLGFTDSRSSDNFMPEGGVQYDVADNVMLYAKAGKSAKSGGYVFSTIVDPGLVQYDDEFALGYEAGLKSILADGAATFNLALFRTRFRDLQLNSFDPVTAAAGIANVGRAVTQGIEAEATWAMTDWLDTRASIAILDGEFKEFDPAVCPIGGMGTPSAVTPGACDASGQSLVHAPDFTGNFSIDWDKPINSNLNVIGGVNLFYSSEYVTDSALEPAFNQDGYARLDARLGIGEADGGWSLSVIGKNLTDEVIVVRSTPFVSNIAQLQAPRTITFQARLNF